MSSNPQPGDNYRHNFALLIPNDVVRRDDGNPAIYIKHKREFIDYMGKEGRLQELEHMTWAQRDEEYLKWLDTMEIIPATREKQSDGSMLYIQERVVPKL